MTQIEIAHLHEIANSLEAERVHYAKLHKTSTALVRAYLLLPDRDPCKPIARELENLHAVLNEHNDLASTKDEQFKPPRSDVMRRYLSE